MEQVMVVDRVKLFGENNERYFEGFKTTAETDWLDIINKNNYFVNRNEAEENPDLLQVIPFVVVKKQSEFFATHKLQGTTDKRELGAYSIAVGGHINPVDIIEKEDALLVGAEREFFEEVNYKGKFDKKLIGFVNNETDMFNKVHFGAVFLQEVDKNIWINENEKHKIAGEFMTVDELNNIHEKFGYWSQCIIDRIDVLL